MVYWWSICSVFALYISWKWQSLVWEDAPPVTGGYLRPQSEKAYVALQLLALFGMQRGQIICHLRELDAVCFLTVLSLRTKRKQVGCTLLNDQTRVHTNTTLYWHHSAAVQLSWPGWCLNSLQLPSPLLSSSWGLSDKGSEGNIRQASASWNCSSNRTGFPRQGLTSLCRE